MEHEETDPTAERLRAQEAELQQEHDTSGLAAKLRQVQNDVESRQLEGTIRLERARHHIDSAPSEEATEAEHGDE